MNELERNNYSRRKQQSDWVIGGATVLSVVSWIVAFAAVIFVDRAAPDRWNFAFDARGAVPRTAWDESYLIIAFALLVFSLCACVMAFIFNMLRMRRKTDKYRKSIIVIGGMTLLGILFFMFRFGPYVI